MKHTVWLLLFFYNACLFGENEKPSIGEVKEIESGLYVAEGTTAAGEKIYFGLERLETQDQRDAWIYYSDACQKLVDKDRGWLVAVGTKAYDKKAYTKLNKEEVFKTVDEASFKKLVRGMRKMGFTPKGKKWETLHATRHGMAGFGPYFSSHVAYISTKPITKRLSKPASIGTYKEIASKYGRIIMSVCSTVSDTKPIYENRGIFRNPLNLIKGNYANIACMLHVFTAKAMKNQNMQHLTVRALPFMKELLVKTIGSDKIKIGDEIPESLREFPAMGLGMFDINMLINLDDIAEFYN